MVRLVSILQVTHARDMNRPVAVTARFVLRLFLSPEEAALFATDNDDKMSRTGVRI